ncbi:MAG: primosomal protein N' [Candidatus Caenarcaniphilales bacterium]|jgi:primosomal protein N' (replication factor Y)|nr:primosomal protein N' [Candidatus Caenarcaniphilales bacterium]
MPYCKVILNNSSQNFSEAEFAALSYEVPESLVSAVQKGSLVLVPFRNQKSKALVIDTYDILNEEEQRFKIRPIEELLELNPIVSEELIELYKYIAEYYACTLQDVVQAALPNYAIKEPNKSIILLDANTEDSSELIEALKKARKNTLSWARAKALTRLNESALKAQVNKLLKKNILKIDYSSKQTKASKANHQERLEITESIRPDLNLEQKQVLEKILSYEQAQKFLLHGVTGSGKTEVYLSLLEHTLAQNKSAIVLIPEITLAPQTCSRIIARFPEEQVLIWHSALTQAEKTFSYQALLSDKPKIIVGARSAILSPVKNLGLIIVDESHENSYKQEEPSPRYHAINVAEKRAELSNCHLLLGTATPSIDTYYRAINEDHSDFHLLTMRNRVFANPLPDVSVIDMREEFNNANKSIFSRLLKINIDNALANKEQVILYLNKRGNASHVFCRACGFVYKCPNCDAKIVYHSDKAQMLCHHCGHNEQHPNECPTCESIAIKFFGLGTQKLEIETAKAFPEARIARLDSDVSRERHRYIEVLKQFANNEIDILIGTQMIAKGLDNPNLTVVGVISADTNMSQIDYQSDERAFQLLTQVAGRAGRADKPGKVILQTYQPERSVIEFARNHDFVGFYQEEIQIRESCKYPPFAKVLRFKASSEFEYKAISVLNKVHELIFANIDVSKVEILGPLPTLISRINNKYRYHIVVKIPFGEDIHKVVSILKLCFNKASRDADVVLSLDVDNISLY